MKARALSVTILELPARWNAREEALAEIDARLDGTRTDLVVLPELALTGYVSPRGDFDLAPFAEPLDGPTTRELSARARRHRCHLVGPLVLRDGDTISNAAVLFDRAGDIRAVYKKRHPWLPERWATAGAAPHPLVTIEGFVVTIAICYDLHFLPAEATKELDAADLLVFTSAWVDEEDTRLPLLRALARRHRVAVVNANWREGVVVVPGQGGSVVLDAKGRVVAHAGPLAGVVTARLPSGEKRELAP